MSRALDILNDVYNLTITGADGEAYGYPDLCLLAGDAPERSHGSHSSDEDGHEDAELGSGFADAPHVYTLDDCASRGADLFAAPVSWDQTTLLDLAGPNATGQAGENDYANVLRMRALGTSMLMYGAFNATGAYHASLRYVNASEDYATWQPTTLQIPFLLEYTHDANRTELAKQWETAMATYLTTGDYMHADAVKVSCIVESTFESAMQDGLYMLTPWIFVVVTTHVGSRRTPSPCQPMGPLH